MTCSEQPKQLVEFDVKGVRLTPGEYEVMQELMRAEQVDLAGFIKLVIDFSLHGLVDVDYENQPKMREKLLATLNQEA